MVDGSGRKFPGPDKEHIRAQQEELRATRPATQVVARGGRGIARPFNLVIQQTVSSLICICYLVMCLNQGNQTVC